MGVCWHPNHLFNMLLRKLANRPVRIIWRQSFVDSRTLFDSNIWLTHQKCCVGATLKIHHELPLKGVLAHSLKSALMP